VIEPLEPPVYNSCMKPDNLFSYLDDLPLGGWRFFESLGSTNDIAQEWANNGATDMSLVVADTQTAGRGRFQRHWVTHPGSALAFSLVMRPTQAEMQIFYRFAGLGAVAIVTALDHFGLKAEIKWPNDVLLQRKKIAGILIENTWIGDQLQALVIGIGINIAPASVPPADQVMFPATCIEQVLGKAVDRWAVLRKILESLSEWRQQLGSNAFMNTWEDRLALKGEWVRISAAGGPERIGRVLGINPEGSLRLLGEEGAELLVDAGDVHLRTVDNAH
jgi:BirA family biotin operon repressor/biotin-[acetyl-CoA-carboxylase] ligase